METPAVDLSPPVASDPLACSPQQTLAQPFTCKGVGLHLGQLTTVRVLPAGVDQGRYFVRVDLEPPVEIATHVDQVSQTRLSTELGGSEQPSEPPAATVRTVEHLLATLWACGIDNARIEIDGPEVPLLDGSAQDWAAAIEAAGIQAQSSPRSVSPSLSQPICVQSGDAFVMAVPASQLRFSYGIDFDLAAIGNQWYSWSPAIEPFTTAIAPARTFGLAHQIDYLRDQGLIKGGSLDNALVCGKEGWLNPPLRFSNEPVRHKLLDLVGDLSLLGVIPCMHVTAYKASHQLHVELARKLSIEP